MFTNRNFRSMYNLGFIIGNMRKINKIIVHCTATRICATPEKIAQYHVLNLGWHDCGYHFLITHNGIIHTMRPLDKVGAHCNGHNVDSIGIALIGGKYSFDFSIQQLISLVSLLKTLCRKYSIPKNQIFNHHDFNKNKACPRFNIQNLIQYENFPQVS